MVAGKLFAVVRRGVESLADLAGIWKAKQRVAKLQVCRRGSRAYEVAERKAVGAEVADLMMDVWLSITSERRMRENPRGSLLPAAVAITQIGAKVFGC
jgi:hypothetical protein